MKDYDVIIVGAGLLGMTLALQLERKGIHRVLLIDQSRVGYGVTQFTGGMVRVFHSDSILADHSLCSLQVYRKEAGDAFLQKGAISILPPHWQEYAESEMNRWSKKVDARWLTEKEVRDQYSYIHLEQGERVLFEPQAGSVNVSLWLSKIRHHLGSVGVHWAENQSVLGFERNRQGGIVGVKTKEGKKLASTIVLAAGIWTPALTQKLGVDLPLNLKAIQLEQWTGPRLSMPNLFDYRKNLYLQETQPGVYVGGHALAHRSAKAELLQKPSSWEAQRVDEELRVRMSAKFNHERTVVRTMDVYGDQSKGLAGCVPGHPGLYIFTGWGGTGFKLVPSLAHSLAEEILRGLENESSTSYRSRAQGFSYCS